MTGPAHITSRAAHVPGRSAPHSPRLPCRHSGLGDGKRCGQSQGHHPARPCRPLPWLWPPCRTRPGWPMQLQAGGAPRPAPASASRATSAALATPEGPCVFLCGVGHHVALTGPCGVQDLPRAVHPGKRVVPGRDRRTRSAAARGWGLCMHDRDVLTCAPLGQCWALERLSREVGRVSGRLSEAPGRRWPEPLRPAFSGGHALGEPSFGDVCRSPFS